MAATRKPTPPPDEPVNAELVDDTPAEEPAEQQSEDVTLEQTDAVDPDTGEILDAQEAEVIDPNPVLARHGLSALPTSSDSREWTDEQKALLDAAGLVKRQGGQVIPAPRATIAAFLTQCHRTGLDPIARQIYCVERAGKWTIQISIDGFRLIAERTGGYRGQTAPQWTADGVTWVEVWLDAKNPPAAARVGVHREGFIEPVWGIATFEGYCPRDRNGNLDPRNQWKTNPSNQLVKCAEMQALRKAFPMELSGLYGTEEMDQADRAETARPGVTTARPSALSQPRVGTLREIHAAGVDEHKLPDSGDDGDNVTGQRHPDTPAEAAPADAGADRWQLWKDRIDAAPTLVKLTGVRNEMMQLGLLEWTVPGTDKKVSDYFEHRRTVLSAPATAAAARLQQGLKQDAPAMAGEAS